MRKLLLTFACLTIFTASSFATCPIIINGTIGVAGDVPTGWDPSFMENMNVEIYVEVAGVFQHAGTQMTNGNGFYQFTINNSGTFKVKPIKFTTPYEGTFDNKPQTIVVDCSQNFLNVDFVYDFTNY